MPALVWPPTFLGETAIYNLLNEIKSIMQSFGYNYGHRDENGSYPNMTSTWSGNAMIHNFCTELELYYQSQILDNDKNNNKKNKNCGQ